MVDSFISHLTREGDRWDLLAWQYYRNPYGYEPIIAANVEFIGVAEIPSGIRLQIPAIAAPPTQAKQNLPPWRQ